MSKPIPQIQKHMTSSPHSIGNDQTIATAASMMDEHHIRHLPVLHGGRLLGILSDRDIKLIETFRDVDPTKIQVEEAMTEQPYSVSPEAPLDEVVETMAANKYGCAVVLQNGKVVGIFTTVDVCEALAQLLRTPLASDERGASDGRRVMLEPVADRVRAPAMGLTARQAVADAERLEPGERRLLLGSSRELRGGQRRRPRA